MKIHSMLLILFSVALVKMSACSMTMPVVATESASTFLAGEIAEGAPPELMHWEKLVGRWTATADVLKADGSGWDQASTADWDFQWAFGGWGIQDNYTSPSLSEEIDEESKRRRGINLRVYNPAEKQWTITWLTTTLLKPMALTATSTDESIVMLPDEKNAAGFFTRSTFFDMTETSFEWKQERSNDQENWLEVYRIHARKLQQ